MRCRALAAASLVALTACAAASGPAELDAPPGFTPIFDGRTLDGWHVSRTSHQGTNPDVRVEDGAIVLRQNPFGQGGVLLTDRPYDDFELYLEVKPDRGTNGGIFFRSTESGSAYQVEVEGAGLGGTGNLLGEMLRVTTDARAERLREDVRVALEDLTGDIHLLELDLRGEMVGHPDAGFNAELARIPELVREPLAGMIRRGQGFLLDPEEAESILASAPENAAVLRPIYNGRDLARRYSGNRAIDFGLMTEAEARGDGRDIDVVTQDMSEWTVFSIAGEKPSYGKVIFEKHGGRIECQSAPGRGTTVTARLPAGRG